MPLLSINACEDGALPHAETGPLRTPLAALLGVPGPVTIMIHGYKFAPHGAHCPHRHILSLTPRPGCRRAISWPRHLGLGQGGGAGIAFGWHARGSLPTAYREAARAGRMLAALITEIARIAPQKPIRVLAHSLGARVYLQALTGIGATPTRAVLMAGAEFSDTARHCLAGPAGQRADILNVVSRENDLFDLLFERRLQSPRGRRRALGYGLAEVRPGWCDLMLDDPETLCRLEALGHRVPPPSGRVCHWFAYLRPGVFGLYRAFLADDGHRMTAMLRAGPQAPQDLRWWRLLALHRRTRALPTPQKAPC